MRKPLVAGNWKMNLDLAAARSLVEGVRSNISASEAIDIAVCPPFIYLFPIAKAIAGSTIQMGAQDIYFEKGGAFTGECSGAMVAETGCRYVILGHSERRHTIGHHEDDWMINRKVNAALAAGLTPILCVGETLAQREADQTMEVVSFQVAAGISGLAIDSAEKLVIAYEPVWAIGTGRTATPNQAQEVHAHIRGELRKRTGDLAEAVRILYGGSMTPDNAADLVGQPDVDGGLIGGASLKIDAFCGIIAATVAASR
jgi:triosephosphate isomerase